MTSSFTPGAPASSSRTNEAASSTCSKLSSSSSVCLLAQVLEQRLPSRVSRPFLDPELVGDRPRDEYRVGDAAELDEHGACGPAFENAGHLERQARLPRSGCTRQRQEPHLLATQKRADLPQLTRSPHERRRATLRAWLRLRCAVC